MKDMLNTVNGQYIGYNMPINIAASYGPEYVQGTHTVNLYGNNPRKRDEAVKTRITNLRNLHGDNVIVLNTVKSLTNRGYLATLSYEIL